MKGCLFILKNCKNNMCSLLGEKTEVYTLKSGLSHSPRVSIAKILILFQLFSIYIQKSGFSLPHPSSLLSLTSSFPSLSLSILPFFFLFYKKWNHTIEFSVFLFCIVISSDCIGIQKICVERSEIPHHFFFFFTE